MTREELMKPRFEVTAPAPILDEHIKVGQVIELDEYGVFHIEIPNEDGLTITVNPKKYPHLFKELHWATHRELSDLPRFMKDAEGNIGKVDRYDFVGRHKFVYFDGSKIPMLLVQYEPATEAEYLKEKEKQ